MPYVRLSAQPDRGMSRGAFWLMLRRVAVFAACVDFVYLLPLGQGPWKFLTGGGPTIVLTKFSDDELADFGTEVSAGGSYLLGFAHDNGFFTEFRIGGGNVPALKMGAGWTLKLR